MCTNALLTFEMRNSLISVTTLKKPATFPESTTCSPLRESLSRKAGG